MRSSACQCQRRSSVGAFLAKPEVTDRLCVTMNFLHVACCVLQCARPVASYTASYVEVMSDLQCRSTLEVTSCGLSSSRTPTAGSLK